jgi:parallel beta-helix repeat protein
MPTKDALWTALVPRAKDGKEYYVAPDGKPENTGVKDSPWDLASVLGGKQPVAPGDVVWLRGGTYGQGGRTIFYSTLKGTEERPIFIRQYPGERATIDGGIQADDAWIWFWGFEITNSSLVRASVGGAGIEHGNYAATDDESIGNLVYRIGVGRNCNTVHGIYHSQLRGRILNNIVYLADGWGIHLWHAAQYLTIANNTVFNNRQGGIIVGDGDAPGGIVDDYTVVTNNIAVGNGGYGISELGATGPHNAYSHNLVHGNASVGMKLRTGTETNTINADPQFVNFQPNGGGDYHLKPTSPAIDAGVQNDTPSYDYDGGARPHGSGMDIGAYEAGSSPAAWPWYWANEAKTTSISHKVQRRHPKP